MLCILCLPERRLNGNVGYAGQSTGADLAGDHDRAAAGEAAPTEATTAKIL